MSYFAGMSAIRRYRLAACCSDYAGIRQRWLYHFSKTLREMIDQKA